VVVSHDLWKRRFNGVAGIIGSQLSVEGIPLTIVGVVQGFRGVDVGQSFDIAMPFAAEALIRGRRSLRENQRALLLTVMLRLKPGQAFSEASAAVRAMQPRILEGLPPQFQKDPFRVVPASTGISDRSQLRQRYERPLVTLAVVSGLVLAIVCVNIANLFLARASARRRELSLRLAVGAPRWRLARHLFIEGLVLGMTGVIFGVVIAAWGSRALVAQLPAPDGPVMIDLSVDWRVMTFAIAVTMIAVVLFGTVPALYATRVPPLEALQEEGRAPGGQRTGVLSNALIVAQVALSIVLLTAAGLFIRTLNRLVSVPLGFEPRSVIVVTVNTARSSTEPAARMRLCDQIREAVEAVPGVTRAAGSIWTPVGTGGGGVLADARGRRADVGRQVAFNFITPGWFATYGTAIHMGRDVDAHDHADARRVALVNETFRRTLLRGHAAVGETIEAGPCGRGGCTVVGVVADTVYGRSLRDVPPSTVYVPLAQADDLPPNAPFRLSVRAAGDPSRLVPDLAEALHRVDPRLAYSFRPVEADITASVAQERLAARLAGLLGGIGVLLSAIGLYGVSSYTVTRRRGEIGIRLALGGQSGAVVRVILKRIALLVLAGTVVGLSVAVWLSRFVAPLLYGLESRDPVTLAAATMLLALVAAVAGWIPAARAVRVDPAQVLRQN
jgi:predicted permease